MKVSGNVLLLITCCSHVACILLFMRGFFPIKSFLPGYSSYDDMAPEPGTFHSVWPNRNLVRSENLSEMPLLSPVVGRAVFIIIDALRADFVFDEKHSGNMPFLRQLMAKGEGLGFVAKAHPPTVTLPRIKALTTGTIPGYIDVLLNFDSSQLVEDNLIEQAVRATSVVVFYGDETWMKLFPKHFSRSEGTTSFFVTDFTEVDDNVTRHLDAELRQSDWNVLILHYLGMDHIGHVAGPQSPLIGTKLREMDGVIKHIYSELVHEVSTKSNAAPPLIVVCGDHGMSDAGSHGGASAAETNVPIVFLSPALSANPKVTKMEIHQIDVVPTLAALLGIPIPKNSIGRLVTPIFEFLDQRQKLYLALVNAQQVMQVAKQYLAEELDANVADFYITRKHHEDWLSNNCSYRVHAHECKNTHNIFTNYSRFTLAFNEIVASKSTKYDMPKMLLAILIHWLNLIFIVFSIMRHPAFHSFSRLSIFLWCALISHAASLASSSFVEEEHQTWNCIATTAFCLLFVNMKAKQTYFIQITDRSELRIFSIIILLRICRGWNSTGDKWAHLPDLEDWLNNSEHRIWLSLSCICGLATIVILRGRHHEWPKRIFLTVIAALIYIYRVTVGFLDFPETIILTVLSPVTVSKLIYSLIGIFLLSNCFKRRNSTPAIFLNGFLTSWIFLAVLILRPHNILLVALITLQQEIFTKVVMEDENISVIDCTLLTLCLAQCSFFHQGNSNSLARIDLAGGYVGLNTYNPALVGVLLTCSTYAGPISWLLNLSVVLNSRNPPLLKESLMLASFTLLLSRTLPGAFYCAVAYLQRYHLFVWTVFSPKLLFEAAFSGMALLVVLYFEMVAVFATSQTGSQIQYSIMVRYFSQNNYAMTICECTQTLFPNLNYKMEVERLNAHVRYFTNSIQH